MKFHEFGDKNNKPMILIHGVLTPWQIWQPQAEYFKQNYFVAVPALDAHIEEEASEFLSIDDEAAKIEAYVKENFGGRVYALCGLSMGGKIANRIFERRNISIDNLVLDGAPLVKGSFIAKKFMTMSYISIIHKSKQRDKKTLENFKKDFLPEKYIESFLKFADTMSDSSIENMISGVCDIGLSGHDNKNGTKILFMHGTKGNEVYSVKAAGKMSELYKGSVAVKQFDGCKHCEIAVYEPEKWCGTVDSFLKGENITA